MENASAPHKITTFIFDLDGVIWRGNAPIEGAVESLAQLRADGKRCLFCTNNSRRTPAEFAAQLREIGIEADEGDIATSSTATVLYLQSQFTGPFTAYVIGEEGLVAALRRTGAIITTSPIIPQRSDLREGQGSHGKMDCVVVGIDATFSYHKMRLAQRLILGGARFIATNRDSTFPTPHGVVPGAGAIVAAIETATGISPVVLGKPQPLMIQLLAQTFGLKPEEIAFVGDRLDTDMAAAHRAGVQGLFVATGVHTINQARRAKGEQKPDGIYEDLPALCAALSEKSAKVADVVAAAAVFGVSPAEESLYPNASANGATANGATNNGANANDSGEFVAFKEAQPMDAPIDEDEVAPEPLSVEEIAQGTQSDDAPAIFSWNATPLASEPIADEPATQSIAPETGDMEASEVSFAWQDAPLENSANKTGANETSAPAPPVGAFSFSNAESTTSTSEASTLTNAAPVATQTADAPQSEPAPDEFAQDEPAPDEALGGEAPSGEAPSGEAPTTEAEKKTDGGDNWWESLDKLV